MMKDTKMIKWLLDFDNVDVKLTASTFQLKQGYIIADTEHSV